MDNIVLRILYIEQTLEIFRNLTATAARNNSSVSLKPSERVTRTNSYHEAPYPVWSNNPMDQRSHHPATFPGFSSTKSDLSSPSPLSLEQTALITLDL